MGKIGKLCEIRGEIAIEWKIKDYFLLSDERDKRYDSPTFYFSGTSWEIRIFPNGHSKTESKGWVSLYLARMSSGPPFPMDFKFSFKTTDGRKDSETAVLEHTFDEKNIGKGIAKTVLREKLVKRKSELTTSEDLTIICSMETSNPNAVSGSYFCRLQEMSDDFMKLYLNETKADTQLKVEEEKFNAHRIVLETRSSYFNAMFKHDMKEKQTGEVTVTDMDKDTFETIIIHIYSGDINTLKKENVFSLYVAADKYHLESIKHLCLEFIIKNLSVEWICDVIKFCKLYENMNGPMEITDRVRQFFKDNAGEILETDDWKNFAKEDHETSIQILSSALKASSRK